MRKILTVVDWSKSGIMATALLALSGCAQQNGAAVHDDPDHLMSSERWEVYEPKAGTANASIVASGRDAILQVLCNEGELGIIVGSYDGAELKAPGFALAIDGTLTEYDWISVPDEEGWGFGLVDSQGDFWPAVAALKRGESVGVVVSEADAEWRRYRFTMLGAAAAIDRAVAQCGQAGRV